MDPEDFGTIAVEAHDGEESMSDRLAAELFESAADCKRLIQSA
jgi:hypothetical protein